MRKLHWSDLFFVLLASFPPLALMVHNITEDELSVVVRPLIFSLLFAVFVFGVSALFTRDTRKSALITSLIIVLFFSFGHLMQSLEGIYVLGIDIGRLRVLIWPVLITLVLGVRVILRSRSIPILLPKYLFLVSAILVSLQLGQIGYYAFREFTSNLNKPIAQEVIAPEDKPSQPDASLPDIYYIILDSYTRQDVLSQIYQFDNSKFINQLNELGFYVGNCSPSNYLVTKLSLSSSLNMDYLIDLDRHLEPNKDIDKFVLSDLIQHSRIRKELESRGYRFYSIEGSYLLTNIPDSYRQLKLSDTEQNISDGQWINPFEEMYIKTTAAIILYRLPLGPVTKWIEGLTFPFTKKALIQQFQLSSLTQVSKEPGPKFVFTHLMIPHFPYIFTADGKIQSDASYYLRDLRKADDPIQRDGYTNQIQFLNNRLPEIIKSIINNSNHPPVIIIQGDHGLDNSHRSAILNAYYFPKANGYPDLYPTISPVNTFRLVSNRLFNTEYPLLPDLTYGLVGDGFGSSVIKDDCYHDSN